MKTFFDLHREFCTCKDSGSVAPLTTRERQIAKAMDSVFKRQLTTANQKLNWTQYSSVIPPSEINNMHFRWVASQSWSDEIYKLTHSHIKVEAEMAGQDAGQKLGVNLTDFIDRPHVQHALKNETYHFAQSVNQSSADKLRNTLISGTNNGESIEQLKQRVIAVFAQDDPERATSWRAEMIARTETAQAYTIGTRECWRETGVVSKAIWKSSSNACPFCLDMDGEEVDLNDSFYKVGDSMDVDFEGKTHSMDFDYRDVDGPPLHVNCRCALVAKTIEIGGREFEELAEQSFQEVNRE